METGVTPYTIRRRYKSLLFQAQALWSAYQEEIYAAWSSLEK
jgi:hypothetical protein